MSIEDGQVTKSALKVASGEFDLESIHSLVLQNAGITDIGCIGECIGLERLDLSRNDITKLHKLAGLSSLQDLNLSSNRISSLDGLQALHNLKNLNLAGNLIFSLDSFQCMCGLEHLKELRLKDDIHNLTNPVCMAPSYVNDVIRMLPNLLVLDGHRVRGKGSELFYLCQDMEKTLNSINTHKEINVPLVDIKRQPSELWYLPSKDTITKYNKAEEQLRDLLTSCHHLSAKATERLQELRQSHTQPQVIDREGQVATEMMGSE